MRESETAAPTQRPPTPEETDLAVAQAQKAHAEAKATLLTAEAEAKKLEHEARDAAAKAKWSELQLVKGEFEAEREIEKRRSELAAHKYHHVYFFKGSVDDSSATKCMDQLTEWMRNDPGEDIEIVFNSPGGGITAGMALWDHIQMVRSAGHKVTTSTIGMAASMAGILLQAGEKRIMGKESWLLIHQASFGAQGSFGDVEDTVKWVEKIQDRILTIFAARSNMTKAQIKNKWHRTDWWISSDEALKLGFVDELR